MAAFGKIFIFILVAFAHCTFAELLQEVCLKRERVCEDDVLTVRCPGKKIDILRALYGRTKGGDKACPYNDPGVLGLGLAGAIGTSNTDCKASNAMKIIRDLCEGRSSCNVGANNDVFGDPCALTYKYLEITYTCLEGDQPIE